ncbi:MAG: outer membrane beta-barrel domain-containing protein [Burkholderiales bacterium]|nr:outer membrane beta-barrel domain-containing protein [Burkholderiales bacterium]
MKTKNIRSPRAARAAAAILALGATLGAAFSAAAQTAPPTPASDTEPVIVPRVERREVPLPRYPSNDFSIGVFGGSYSTQNFGSSGVAGLRLGYAVNEDVFVEATFGRTRVSDANYRLILPGGIFAQRSEPLNYYDVAAGYNVLTGESFFGSRVAKATQGYLLAGIGSTSIAGQRHQTIAAGFGLRVILSDRYSVQVDVRERFFALDLLGQRQSTSNPEVTFGLATWF